MAYNDPRLCEGQGLELQIFNKPQKMIRNTNVDITTNALPFAKPMLADGTGNLLELFAGSRSVGSVAEEKGMNVFSVDWQKFDKINLAIDKISFGFEVVDEDGFAAVLSSKDFSDEFVDKYIEVIY